MTGLEVFVLTLSLVSIVFGVVLLWSWRPHRIYKHHTPYGVFLSYVKPQGGRKIRDG